MSSKRELREQIALLRADVEAWRDTAVRFAASRDTATLERDAVFAELAATRKQRDAAVDAQYQAVTTPEPRPFRVGDRVRVSEGATKKGPFDAQPMKSLVQGMSGEVVRIHTDGDLYVYTDGPCGYVSPEFCTLIEAESESNVPAPPEPTRTGVTLHTHDGRELWIPCEDPDVDPDVDGSKGLWIMPAGRGREAVAWVNPVAIVAAVVTK